MKKLILTSITFVFVLFASAQTNKLASELVNANAIAEDPHNPLVNGIPYNQYKAQQQLKAKQASQPAVKVATPVQPADHAGSLAPTTPSKVAAKKADTDGSTAPPVKKEEAKPLAVPTGAQSVNV